MTFRNGEVIIHKGDTDLAYEISPMYRESSRGLGTNSPVEKSARRALCVRPQWCRISTRKSMPEEATAP